MTAISWTARKILQITDSTVRHQIRPAHHKWSPVWVNNNYEWSCWYDLLRRFIWTFKRHSALTLSFWLHHLSLPLLEKLKNKQHFVVSAAPKRPPIPSSRFVMIVRSYLFKSPDCLDLIIFTSCLGLKCSSRRSAPALEHLPLVTVFLIRLPLRRRKGKSNRG